MNDRRFTRRAFVAAASAPLAALAARQARADKLPVTEESHRVQPVQTHVHAPPPGTAPSPSAIERALQQTVGTLRGLRPEEFVRRFDWGKASTLPDGRTLREYEIVAEDRELEVAPGVLFPAWTYNGSVPGPTLRCTQGDRLRIRFRNNSVSEHTIHFHGIHPIHMDGAVEVVKQGGSYVYEFDAEPAGLHLYHCHVPPVALHLSRGLYGAFIIGSRNPRRDRPTELVMVASGWDLDFDERNELYVVNGAANYYRDHPIRIRVGERVRLYFVNMLEHDPINSLHLHATFFRSYRTDAADEVGEYTDIITLCQADRRIVEFAYEYPGTYMFHAHQNKFAERGWMAHFEVVP
ncbi:MAG: copper oxidase [Deltaproteobacteria bacterium]|nr:MAG: copper oxidase [Deltaproteobacteria bacterium]TMQ06939.1 MAG: copper oxidase [Deltaproteobacteria bacterium]